MRVVPHAKNASQAATCERKRNPVIHGSVRCADGDGRFCNDKDVSKFPGLLLVHTTQAIRLRRIMPQVLAQFQAGIFLR
jgi:hypothetical protein